MLREKVPTYKNSAIVLHVRRDLKVTLTKLMRKIEVKKG